MKKPILVRFALGMALVCAMAQAATAQTDETSAQGSDPASREALIGPPAGPARTGVELEETTEEVAGLMRCPVCQGLSIADSPTVLAQAMKGEVREMLAQGYSEEQVMNYFEESYGEFVRLAPKAKGFNLLVWIAPIAAILLGAWLVALRLRKSNDKPQAGSDEPAQEPTSTDVDDYRERVRREVSL